MIKVLQRSKPLRDRATDAAVRAEVKPTGKDEMAVEPPVKAEAKHLSFSYGSFRALKDINIRVLQNRVTALIGPSGCGKSTFLRCFNRMHDLYPNTHYEGEITLHPENVKIGRAHV